MGGGKGCDLAGAHGSKASHHDSWRAQGQHDSAPRVA